LLPIFILALPLSFFMAIFIIVTAALLAMTTEFNLKLGHLFLALAAAAFAAASSSSSSSFFFLARLGRPTLRQFLLLSGT
jgi:predicted membrane protein